MISISDETEHFSGQCEIPEEGTWALFNLLCCHGDPALHQ